MKKILLTSAVLSLLFMTACGSVDEVDTHQPDPVASEDSLTDDVSVGDDTSSDVGEYDDSAVHTGSVDADVVSGSYDRFYVYMLNAAPDQNAVFSSESLNSAFCIYAALLDDAGAAEINDFVGGADYLAYNNTDVFKTVNRLWLNSLWDADVSATGLSDDIVYSIDMSDPSATDEKNQYVSDMTNGFINSTPSVFTGEMLFDAMNITYFKDTWRNGDKSLTSDPVSFHNADGSVIDCHMIEEHDGGCVLISDTACAYSMQYNDGFEFVAILPNEGKLLSDVSINDFVFGNADRQYYDAVNFYMPEFETESFYECSLGSFGIQAETLDPAFFAGATDPADVMQIAKIRVDHTGTEAAAVSEIMKDVAAAVGNEFTEFDFICDRPFAYYIYDTENEDVAFMGVVVSCEQ